MSDKPFWETSYRDKDASTFSKGPTVDLGEYYPILKVPSTVLDVGCGEGRNSIFLAGKGHAVDAFEIYRRLGSRRREASRPR